MPPSSVYFSELPLLIKVENFVRKTNTYLQEVKDWLRYILAVEYIT